MALKKITQLPKVKYKDVDPEFTLDQSIDDLARAVDEFRNGILVDPVHHLTLEYLYSIAVEIKKMKSQ